MSRTIYVDGHPVRILDDPDDPSDEFAAVCRWVESMPLGRWETDPPYVTTHDGREVTVAVRSSVSIAYPEGAEGGAA